MKSLRIIVRRLGGPEVLETLEEEAPEPGQSDVRVRVLAADELPAMFAIDHDRWHPAAENWADKR